MIEEEIFFCHPQSPHEKGTVENRNKAVRRYIKKKTDLSQVSEEVLFFVEEKLRNKFMKCLNYRTPKEVFQRELEKNEVKKTVQSGKMRSGVLLKASVRIEGSV